MSPPGVVRPAGDRSLRSALTMIADVVVLGALVIVASVGVVTLVPAVAAAVVVAERRDGDGDGGESVVAVFVREFRALLRRGTGVGVVLVAAAGVFVVDVLYVLAQPAGWQRTAVFCGCLLLGLVVGGLWVWCAPLLAHSEVASLGVLRLGLLFAFGHPLTSLAGVVVWGAAATAAVAFVPVTPVVVALAVHAVAALCRPGLLRAARNDH